MGLDAQSMVDVIVGGTSGYLVEFLPIGVFIIGITLAFRIMSELIELFVDLRGYRNSDYSSFREYRKDRLDFSESYDEFSRQRRKSMRE